MKNFIVFCLSLFSFLSFGQNLNPVKWEAVYKSKNNNEGEIIITAKIEKGWHIYSQNISPDAGPIPTSFIVSPGNNFELASKILETNPIEIHDKAFDAKLMIFEEKGIFTQKIKLKNIKGFNSIIKVEFMVCNDMQCLPPKTVDIAVNIPAVK